MVALLLAASLSLDDGDAAFQRKWCRAFCEQAKQQKTRIAAALQSAVRELQRSKPKNAAGEREWKKELDDSRKSLEAIRTGKRPGVPSFSAEKADVGAVGILLSSNGLMVVHASGTSIVIRDQLHDRRLLVVNDWDREQVARWEIDLALGKLVVLRSFAGVWIVPETTTVGGESAAVLQRFKPDAAVLADEWARLNSPVKAKPAP
jgi:hypothetical protein